MNAAVPIRERVSVTVRDASEFTGISRTTIYEMIASGEIESCKVQGRRLVLVSSLIRMVEGDRKVTAPVAAGPVAAGPIAA